MESTAWGTFWTSSRKGGRNFCWFGGRAIPRVKPPGSLPKTWGTYWISTNITNLSSTSIMSEISRPSLKNRVKNPIPIIYNLLSCRIKPNRLSKSTRKMSHKRSNLSMDSNNSPNKCLKSKLFNSLFTEKSKKARKIIKMAQMLQGRRASSSWRRGLKRQGQFSFRLR